MQNPRYSPAPPSNEPTGFMRGWFFFQLLVFAIIFVFWEFGFNYGTTHKALLDIWGEFGGITLVFSVSVIVIDVSLAVTYFTRAFAFREDGEEGALDAIVNDPLLRGMLSLWFIVTPFDGFLTWVVFQAHLEDRMAQDIINIPAAVLPAISYFSPIVAFMSVVMSGAIVLTFGRLMQKLGIGLGNRRRGAVSSRPQVSAYRSPYAKLKERQSQQQKPTRSQRPAKSVFRPAPKMVTTPPPRIRQSPLQTGGGTADPLGFGQDQEPPPVAPQGWGEVNTGNEPTYPPIQPKDNPFR